jgi:GAF domain-containing protein
MSKRDTGPKGSSARKHQQPEIDYLNVVLTISQLTVSGARPDRMMDLIADHMRSELKFQQVRFFLMDRRTGEPTFHAGTPDQEAYQVSSPRARDLIAKVANTRRMAAMVGHETDQAASEIAVPIMLDNELLGVLDVQSLTPDEFTEIETTTIRLIANQVAMSVDRPQPLVTETDIEEMTRPIFRATHQIATATEPDEIVYALRRYILQDADWISVIRVGFGTMGEAVSEPVAYWDREGLALEAGLPESVRRLVTNQQIIAPDVSQLGEDKEALKAYAGEILQVSGLAILPLIGRARTIGYLIIGTRKPRVYSVPEEQMLQLFAGQIAIILENLSLLDALSRQTERLVLINQLSQGIATTLEFDDLGQLLANSLSQFFPLKHLSMTEYEPDRSDVRLNTLQGANVSVQIPLQGTSFEKVLNEGKTLRLTTFNSDFTDAALWSNKGVPALIIVPIAMRGRQFGTLNIGVEKFSSLQEEDINLCEQIVLQMAIAIENMQLFERLQETLEETTTLYSTALAINAAHNMEEVYSTALGEMAELSQADRIVLYQAGPDPRRIVHYVTEAAVWENGRTLPDVEKKRYEFKEAPILSQFPQSRSNLVFNNVQSDQRLDEDLQARYTEAGVTGLMMIPLSTGAIWLGALLLEAHNGQTFSGEQVRLSRSVADQAALAIDSLLLLAQTQAAAQREQALREIIDRIRDARDVETIMEVAETELAKTLGIPPEKLRGLTWRGDDMLSPEEWDMVENVGNQVALAIENLDLIQGIQQTARRDQVISDITAELQRSATVDDVMRTTVLELQQVLREYNIQLRLAEPRSGTVDTSSEAGGDESGE